MVILQVEGVKNELYTLEKKKKIVSDFQENTKENR